MKGKQKLQSKKPQEAAVETKEVEQKEKKNVQAKSPKGSKSNTKK